MHGQYDDLLALFDTACEKEMLLYIKERVEEGVRLLPKVENWLVKWLPSVNTLNKQNVLYGKRIAKALGMNDCKCRKLLVNYVVQKLQHSK